MKKDLTLEKHKFFPIIAWILVFGFCAFTYMLVISLSKAADQLSEQKQKNISALEEGVFEFEVETTD